mmetsp:Transcript_1533/g.3575  ORF Transcript_1533/g.3575 Transcript_1533/m.3575 type:complete len:324 (+) Transcript_1533:847-1818(+)
MVSGMLLLALMPMLEPVILSHSWLNTLCSSGLGGVSREASSDSSVMVSWSTKLDMACCCCRSCGVACTTLPSAMALSAGNSYFLTSSEVGRRCISIRWPSVGFPEAARYTSCASEPSLFTYLASSALPVARRDALMASIMLIAGSLSTAPWSTYGPSMQCAFGMPERGMLPIIVIPAVCSILKAILSVTGTYSIPYRYPVTFSRSRSCFAGSSGFRYNVSRFTFASTPSDPTTFFFREGAVASEMMFQCWQGIENVGDSLRAILANCGFVFSPEPPANKASPSQVFSISPYTPPVSWARLRSSLAFSCFTTDDALVTSPSTRM